MNLKMNEIFVFDTYAIIEIIRGNKKYEDYINKRIIINDFIFAELCYILIREEYPKVQEHLNRYAKFIVHVDSKTIEKAMGFRFKNKKDRLSMTDCISYFMAKKLGIKFLTGDKEFEEKEDVEFVRKE